MLQAMKMVEYKFVVFNVHSHCLISCQWFCCIFPYLLQLAIEQWYQILYSQSFKVVANSQARTGARWMDASSTCKVQI